MGKKKGKANTNNPESMKEIGNKAFLQKEYEEARMYYTYAIELSRENPSPVYYSNRANALLENGNYKECLADCDEAIKIDPSYSKTYVRKAKA